MIYKKRDEINTEDYIIATYKGLDKKGAWGTAIGQSVGNPEYRSKWETEELFRDHSCLILEDGQIAFPLVNIDLRTDGISHLLVMLMGGQLDIRGIDHCQLVKLEFPEQAKECFMGPKYGIRGIRDYTKCQDRPLLGGIIKPKTGVSPSVMLDMVKEMVDGGVNFIKEDEILSDPSFCRIKDRVPMIMDYLHDKNVVYSVSIHADPPYLLDRVKLVNKLGGNSVHVNFWCGLGSYKAIRELDLNMFVHFQKSGDKIFTNPNHNFSIAWPVVCQLIGMMGVDFAHAGMIGGYYKWDEQETYDAIEALRTYGVMPALSCGFNDEITAEVTEKVGIDYMANVGGFMHSYPGGTQAGARAMRESIDNLF